MDRSSRFQNPIPLSSGGFHKPPSIQGDSVGMKPLPPLILDRFRALVKEREEELRVFGGAALLPLNTDEIVRIYEILLSELVVNSKPIITDLTIIAGEQRAHGEGIAGAICSRIIEVSVDHKLPSLYLLDSIVKNIGKEYIKFFSSRLPEVFCEAYSQVHPNMHQAMRHLFGTWSSVFPLPVLQKIETQLQFSSSVNDRSSGLSSSRASESPRPTHGIHINPKYLEAQHQFGHSTGDPFGTEGVSSTGRAGLTTSGLDAVKKSTARITRSTSPYQLGPSGSLSPSVDEFNMETSSKIGAFEETSEWRKRDWQGHPKPQLKASSSAYKYESCLDLRGPRALISAYGIDEREKHLKHHKTEEFETNGGEQKVSVRTWQNTEEEEFNWDDMTPNLAGPRQTRSNDIYPSLTARHNFTTNNTTRLPGHGFAKLAGPSDLSSYTQEPSILPPQQSQSHFKAKVGGSFDQNRMYSTASEQKPQFIGNFSNIDGKVGGPSTYSSTHDSPASEIRLADAPHLSKPWNPPNFQNSQILPSALPMQMPFRGQFGNFDADQIHFDPGSTRSMPQISSFRPGPSPVNMQNTTQPSLVQSNMLPLHSSAPILSNTMVPSLNYGYLAQGRGPFRGPNLSNLVPGMQSLPIPNNAPNMQFHVSGATVPPLLRGPFPGTTQALPMGQVGPNAAGGGALSGLITSLMAQGLISITKQDSALLEFDQERLKVRNEYTINSLYADLPRQCTTCGLRFKGQEDHSKHMDWHVNKNRTLKNRKTKPSPKWFVSVNMWLTGTEALGNEAGPGFLPADNTVEKDEDEELAVPADEEQNACALCGEPFDDFYSDETEEWMYRGAMYMYEPSGGLTVGMDRLQLGPIVHAKCRPDSHGVSSEDFRKGESESTEERLRS